MKATARTRVHPDEKRMQKSVSAVPDPNNMTGPSSTKKRATTESARAPLEDISNKRAGMIRLEKSTKIVGAAQENSRGIYRGTRSHTKTTTSHPIPTHAPAGGIFDQPLGELNLSGVSLPDFGGRTSFGSSISSRRESLDLMDVDNDDIEVELPKGVRDIDAYDGGEPLCVSTYVNEIYTHLKVSEQKYKPSNYMATQSDITPSMRAILIDWLVEVAEEYKLASETLYLCANYLDRYLSRKIVVRGHLQLLGIVCMLIASKFEEVYAPAVDEFVYISDNTYSKDEMFEMEEIVLNVLKFSLSAPTIKTFLRRFLKAAGASSEVTSLANFLCELTLQEFTFTKYLPSMVASCAVALALHSFNLPSWGSTVEYYSGYSLSDPEVKNCLMEMYTMYSNFPSSTLAAVKEKYSHSKFFRVSTLPPPSNPPIPMS
eukprot:TRINITY_DN7948_c0_g1_i1.p1 TRINITY_DN7948_c0_g1~~TRINITY_DN7948_c0_g1_i1.p1  ORF type:complete len:430 (+),score=115.84 TRINITY_DN7948_c0_g1_i1:234-1523(+)